MKIITNNHPRSVIEAHELTAEERGEFDYLNWRALLAGVASTSFIRYKGQLYDLDGFERIRDTQDDLRGWDGIYSDTFFSGILVRYVNQSLEYVVVGRYYT